MRTLIAVVSHQHGEMKRQVIRDTWLPLLKEGIEAKFFVGNYEGVLPGDTVNLQCPDAHKDIPGKVKKIARYALAEGYDYMFKCDDDVLLRLEHIEQLIQHRFCGVLLKDFTKYSGFFYGFDKQGMQLVVKSELPVNYHIDEYWMHHIMDKAGIPITYINSSQLVFSRAEYKSLGSTAVCVHENYLYEQVCKSIFWDMISDPGKVVTRTYSMADHDAECGFCAHMRGHVRARVDRVNPMDKFLNRKSINSLPTLKRV